MQHTHTIFAILAFAFLDLLILAPCFLISQCNTQIARNLCNTGFYSFVILRLLILASCFLITLRSPLLAQSCPIIALALTRALLSHYLALAFTCALLSYYFALCLSCAFYAIFWLLRILPQPLFSLTCLSHLEIIRQYQRAYSCSVL